MEIFKSGDKKRVLPTWMTAPGAEKRKVPVKTPKGRRPTAMPVAAAARLAAVRTVYCMSEAEMVDVALGVLIEADTNQHVHSGNNIVSALPVISPTPQAQKQEQPLEPPTLAGTDKPERSPTHSASSSPSSPGSRSEDEDSGKDAPSPGLSPPQGPAGSDSARSRSPEDDEDAFKYVREIFFS